MRGDFSTFAFIYPNSENIDGDAAKVNVTLNGPDLAEALSQFMQKAFADVSSNAEELQVSTRLCDVVLSLPMHPYLTEEKVTYICNKLKEALL